MITCSSYGSVPRVYANSNFYQIREIESLSEQVLYQKVPYGTRYQDLEMPDSIDVFVSGGGQNEDVPDAGSDENVTAFANRTNDDAVLEKMDSEEKGEKEDTEGKGAGEDGKDKSEGGEDLEKAESGSGEQGDSGKDGNSAGNGDSQDENANPGNGESDGKGEDSDSGKNGTDEKGENPDSGENGSDEKGGNSDSGKNESDEKDDSGKTDSGSSGGNADLNEDGGSSNGKTDEPKEDVKTDEKTEEEIDEKEGFWRKVKVCWVLDAEESQASRYDGENPGIYLFRAELKSSNYEVDEDELPVIQITVLEEEQAKKTLEFAPLEESIADQILPLGSKESDIQFPETLTVRETTGEETTERTLPGITWKLDAENSDYSEFQGGLAPEDYFDRFDEDGEPEETEEKTWEGYDKANEEYNGAIYTYVPVIPESEEIPEDTDLPEIHVQVGDAGIALYADEGITGEGTEANPYVIRTADQWSTVMGENKNNKYNGYQFFGVKTYIRLGDNIDLSGRSWESRTLTACLDGDGYTLSGISQPLFSVLNGTVKNLILSDVRIVGTGNQGAIAQTVGNKATVEKCYVSGSITATGSNNSGVGGLIGAAQNAQGAPLTIENCVVNADITGKGSSLAGGLIGSVSNSDVVTIKKCIAMGTVSTVEDKGSGGLVGGPGRSVTIKNSAALQEEVSTKSSKYFVDRIFGYDGDYTVHVVGEHNFAYQDMKVKYGDKLLDKPKDELENYGVSVSKTDLLTTDFWENKIGWRSDTENWKFDNNQLPTLKMKRRNDHGNEEEVNIFSGADIPEYLQATNSLKGSVKSGETGIAGAEIIFKKDNIEKNAKTNSDGKFTIDLAAGTYTVTIKKTGYFTVERTVTISDTDSGALNFTLKVNPVSMPSEQTVTGAFQTTDADTVTADGEIALTYTGDEDLQAKDFKLSSEEDGTEYGEVTISGVEKTENGWGIKIRFAKSLNLDSTNKIQLYVHYKGSSIGSFTLKKEVNLVQLATPADVKWDETVKGKAVWNQVENASGYKVQLYKNGSEQGSAVMLGPDVTSYDFTSQIAESGIYTFGVRAKGDGSTYGDSEEEKSGNYEFSEQTLEDVKKAAVAALQAKTVTNETTAGEILQVVQNVITNKKILATWSKPSPDFQKKQATDGTEPGVNGSITGTIFLSYESRNDTLETIKVDLSIAAKYKITFASGHDDSQGGVPKLENAAAGTVITLPKNTFKVYGMNFKGWSDGTTTYASGASYTMPGKNVAFEAVWTQDKWDGQTVAEPTRDDQGYYQISTGAELAYFQTHAMQKAKLMCDIDLGKHPFTPISNRVVEFDGCRHTIRGLNVVGNMVPTGLFQEISSNCQIKNLTIEDAVVKASNNDARVGILVGDVYDALTVKNCFVSGTIETTDGTNRIEAAGGLIGNVREKYSVEIQSCYADVEIKGTASKRFVGGLVGWTDGTTTIENSYAIVDMDVDKGNYIGGLVGGGNVTISHSYAAGEALTKSSTGAAVAGISNNGSISSCVSIFPEMRSLNRIGGTSGKDTNNYGFAGTVARKSDGTILTPDPDTMGADKQYGADATEKELKNPEFYIGLGWDFTSTWTMDSTGAYAFPILRNQTLSPNLTLDLTPSVTGITLDKADATIYPRGSVQLTATVDVANGASRDVTWKSSNPAVKVEDGRVTAADVAEAGTYTITATSVADPSKQAECQLTVDTAEHTVTVGREPDHTNSLNAVVKAYASLNDAKRGTNPIPTTGSETGTFTFPQKAGETVYLAFTGLNSEDVVSKVTITDKNGSKVDATLCNFEDPTVYYFTMPCSDASVEVSYAVNLNATQYTWFVGQEWGTWGTTADFETKEWSGEGHIGSLKVTKIINGKQFREFNIKSMSLYKKDPVTPNPVNSKADLNKNGDYYIEKDGTTGLPTLYVYLKGPGMVAVDIEVQDNPNAEFSITKKPESSSYYTLNRTTAKVGDLVTATLTGEGVRRMKEMQNKNACLTYSGGLLVVIYPPKFTESGGKWTASFKMPAQNIETNVYFGEKDKVTLKGTDKEFDYDGTPKSVEDGIQATIGGQDLSDHFQGPYEVHYKGVNGTDYSNTTPPTNAGTYSCTVKIPDSNVYYKSDLITVRLTIKKIATKTPKAAQAAAWTDTSVTLEAPSAFVDGTAIPAGYKLEYCVDQGEWQDSPIFTGLTPETTYNFYVRLKEGVNTTASAASEAVTVQTKKASSDPSNPPKPDPTKPDPSNPDSVTPTPSTPGNPQGTTTSGRDRSTSTWVKESTGWRYRLSNGTYLSGSLVLDPATGRQVEQVVWKQLRGAWWAFGADGYIRTGWVYDYSAGEWYYVDENTGMRTGWYLDPQDGKWYYLDPATGEMLTEWQLIPDLGYVYLNPYAPQPTWTYDEELKTWVYMEGAGRPYGSLYMAEWTPDGYYVNADGVWEPAR